MIDSAQGQGANASGNGLCGGIGKILEMEAKLTPAQIVEYKKTTTLAEATAYMKGIFGDGMTADPSSNKARKKRNNKNKNKNRKSREKAQREEAQASSGVQGDVQDDVD